MPRAAVATREGPRVFTDDDAYKTWRVLARNNQYTGETEGIGFSNGQATVSGLPRTAQCPGKPDCDSEGDGDLCRLHTRLFHLNALMNYPQTSRARNASTNRRETVKHAGYRVLSEDEFEREFGDVEPEGIDLDDF